MLCNHVTTTRGRDMVFEKRGLFFGIDSLKVEIQETRAPHYATVKPCVDNEEKTQ